MFGFFLDGRGRIGGPGCMKISGGRRKGALLSLFTVWRSLLSSWWIQERRKAFKVKTGDIGGDGGQHFSGHD